jgi:hypothetical protein
MTQFEHYCQPEKEHNIAIRLEALQIELNVVSHKQVKHTHKNNEIFCDSNMLYRSSGNNGKHFSLLWVLLRLEHIRHIAMCHVIQPVQCVMTVAIHLPGLSHLVTVRVSLTDNSCSKLL